MLIDQYGIPKQFIKGFDPKKVKKWSVFWKELLGNTFLVNVYLGEIIFSISDQILETIWNCISAFLLICVKCDVPFIQFSKYEINPAAFIIK